jgi:hypothetical protein
MEATDGPALRRIYDRRRVIVALCCASIIVCFFLPWFNVYLKPTTLGGLFGGGRPVTLLTMSGADVPQMANGPSAKNCIQVLGMFCGLAAHADHRSY